jgi:PIN domain nuclease of toxin-antitoxin system
MRYLADTQILLWMLEDSPRLSTIHRRILADAPVVFFSSVSIAEIAIKANTGKLHPPGDPAVDLPAGGLDELSFTVAHASRVRGMPRHHGDPFDRMLIAQAQEERLTILTTDRMFASYDVAVV